MFLEGDQRLRELELELKQQSSRLNKIETGLIMLVIVLGGITALMFTRQLTAALQETRRARDDAESQREQNSTILDTLSDGVYATDLNGVITYVNAAAERILGWVAADLVGRHAPFCASEQPVCARCVPLQASFAGRPGGRLVAVVS